MADVSVIYKENTLAELSASGTLTMHTSGHYCEDDILIEYIKPQNETTGERTKVFAVENGSAVSGKWWNVTGADAVIAEHRNADTFGVTWLCLSPAESPSTRGGTQCNRLMTTTDYGIYARMETNGTDAVSRINNAVNVENTTVGRCYVAEDGSIRLFGSSTYPLKAGSYMFVVFW